MFQFNQDSSNEERKFKKLFANLNSRTLLAICVKIPALKLFQNLTMSLLFL